LKNIPENLNENPNDWSCDDFKSMRGNLTRMCNEEYEEQRNDETDGHKKNLVKKISMLEGKLKTS
jgi:hypothetical protein